MQLDFQILSSTAPRVDLMSDNDAENTLKSLFHNYCTLVYNKEFDKVGELYDDNAILVEDNVRHCTPKHIVEAIKKHQEKMKPWGCENYDETFSRVGHALVYSSKFKATSVFGVIHGTYEQFWHNEKGKWLIFRDQVVVTEKDANGNVESN